MINFTLYCHAENDMK